MGSFAAYYSGIVNRLIGKFKRHRQTLTHLAARKAALEFAIIIAIVGSL
jgi:hypothetical protein